MILCPVNTREPCPGTWRGVWRRARVAFRSVRQGKFGFGSVPFCFPSSTSVGRGAHSSGLVGTLATPARWDFSLIMGRSPRHHRRPFPELFLPEQLRLCPLSLRRCLISRPRAPTCCILSASWPPQRPPVHGVTQRPPFAVWLVSLRQCPEVRPRGSRVRMSFLFQAESHSLVWRDHSLRTHHPLWTPRSLLLLAAVGDVTLAVGVHVPSTARSDLSRFPPTPPVAPSLALGASSLCIIGHWEICTQLLARRCPFGVGGPELWSRAALLSLTLCPAAPASLVSPGSQHVSSA